MYRSSLKKFYNIWRIFQRSFITFDVSSNFKCFVVSSIYKNFDKIWKWTKNKLPEGKAASLLKDVIPQNNNQNILTELT